MVRLRANRVELVREKDGGENEGVGGPADGEVELRGRALLAVAVLACVSEAIADDVRVIVKLPVPERVRVRVWLVLRVPDGEAVPLRVPLAAAVPVRVSEAVADGVRVIVELPVPERVSELAPREVSVD